MAADPVAVSGLGDEFGDEDVVDSSVGAVSRDEIAAVHRCAVAFYRGHLHSAGAGAYLRHRLGRVPSGWPVGYAPASGTALVAYLRRRRFTDDVIVGAGLARPDGRAAGRLVDRFRDRVMFAVFDGDDEPVGFVGRQLHPAPAAPRYLNTPVTVAYHKHLLWFGLREARQALAGGARPVLVEGPMDVLAVAVADDGRGELAGVAPCGTSLTDGQLTVLDEVADLSRGLVEALDPDGAGRRARLTLWRHLRGRPGAVAAGRSALLSGGDPADVLRGDGPAALRWALGGGTVSFVDAVVEALLHVPGRDAADADVGTRVRLLRRAAQVADGLTGPELVKLTGYLRARLDLLQETVVGVVCDVVSPPWPAGDDHRV